MTRPSEENRLLVTAHARDQKTCETQQRQGLRGPDSKARPTPNRRLTAAVTRLRNEIVRMHGLGYSRTDIGQELGVTQRTVGVAIAKAVAA